MPRLTNAAAWLAMSLALAGCFDLRRSLVALLDDEYHAVAVEPSSADYDLREVASGFAQITDLQPVPGTPDRLVVLEKTGAAHLLDRTSGDRSTVLKVEVATTSELGLLGLAFHPNFPTNGRFFVNYTPDARTSRISEWHSDDLSRGATEVRTVMEVAQPYQNHDAGQIAFGPDGMLYIGWGDGGFRNDPDGNGQNRGTLLGAMLRIDIDSAQPYAVPADNPWVGQPGVRPEIWAYGLRNPWRFSFDPAGRMVLADVGQDTWEEIDLVQSGDNLGWPVREGRHCFPPDATCATDGFVDPIHEYGRALGSSITGGHVYLGTDLPALQGQYLFADFVSGRIWALPLPEERGGPLVPARLVGQWPVLISTFGRDASGEILVADYGEGRVLRLVRGAGTATDGPER